MLIATGEVARKLDNLITVKYEEQALKELFDAAVDIVETYRRIAPGDDIAGYRIEKLDKALDKLSLESVPDGLK